MDLSSVIEIYTSVLGWILYDGMWAVLAESGLLYIPIVAVVLSNWAAAYRALGDEGSEGVIRACWLDIFGVMMVVTLAGSPFLTLAYGDLRHTRPCGSATATGGNSGTLYDKAFAALDGKSAQVPVWWYGIMAVGNGLSNVGVALVPCSPDLRMFAYKVENTRIQDPELRRQLELFTRDCWQQARAKFNASHGTLPPNYPPEDINWIGSQYFLDTDGYYGNSNINLSLRASEEIPGFPYNATRDTEYLPGFIPNWGRPECKDWWENASSGIKPRLLALIDFDAVTQATVETGGLTLANNALMRKILEPEKVGLGRLTADRFANQFDDPSWLAKGGANLGLAQENVFWRPKIYALRQVAPIGQSLILMGIYFFLPFILLYSGFAIETVFTLSVVIMGIQFLTPIWTLATWLDNHLIEALGLTWFHWNPLDWNPDEQDAKYVLQLAAMLMFVVLPVLWFMAIGWAGLHVHKTLNAANPLDNAIRDAAGAGVNTASKVTGKVMK